MNLIRPLFSLFALAAAPTALLADVTPAPLFQNHAVLQRGKPVPIWGRADADEQISVRFAGQTKSTTAGADGRWNVTLDPLETSATPAALTIVGKNTLTLTDILVGEVWLASGQSNMEWAVRQSYDAQIETGGSANPMIRHIKIARKSSDTPLDTASGVWEIASPSTTGNFTAAGYFFARDLHVMLKVPVGIINSSFGGTPVEAWTGAETLQCLTELGPKIAARWAKTLADYPAAKTKFDADLAAWKKAQEEAKSAGRFFNTPEPRPPQGPGGQTTPSGLYNAMIAPLVPYAIRGTIWYQGESNAGRFAEYHELFSAMITGWRARFGQGDFPFYWVQLANFGANGRPDATEWAFLREAQTRTLSLPATGQAVAIDIGNFSDIHPRDKQAVGRRLARLALARDYGQAIPDSGPVFEQAVREGAGYRIRFTHADGGLMAPLNALSGFEIAGADKAFHPADAKLPPEAPDTVLISSAGHRAVGQVMEVDGHRVGAVADTEESLRVGCAESAFPDHGAVGS